jgi:hypothetical protein
MCLHLPLQLDDLLAQGDQHPSRGPGGHRVGGVYSGIAAQMFGSQAGLDAGGLGLDIAAVGPGEGAADLF